MATTTITSPSIQARSSGPGTLVVYYNQNAKSRFGRGQSSYRRLSNSNSTSTNDLKPFRKGGGGGGGAKEGLSQSQSTMESRITYNSRLIRKNMS